jgi:hypothetical protein
MWVLLNWQYARLWSHVGWKYCFSSFHAMRDIASENGNNLDNTKFSHTQTKVRVCVCVFMYVCIYVCMQYVCMHNLCIYVCIIYVYVCMCTVHTGTCKSHSSAYPTEWHWPLRTSFTIRRTVCVLLRLHLRISYNSYNKKRSLPSIHRPHIGLNYGGGICLLWRRNQMLWLSRWLIKPSQY